MYTFVYVFVQIIKKGNDVVLLELVSRGHEGSVLYRVLSSFYIWDFGFMHH